MHVDLNRAGWDVALPEREGLVTCETLEEARRVAYLCGAHGHACELVVREAHERVHQELIAGQPQRI